MLSLIGTIFGLLGSLIPEWLKLQKAKAEMQHEIEVLKIQADLAKAGHQYRLEEIQAQTEAAIEPLVYKAAEIKYSGVKWVDGLVHLWNGIMRPWIATVMTLFYCAVKYAQYRVITAGGTDMWQTVWQLWTSEDMAIFATIISFFFGGRIVKYAMQHGGVFLPTVQRNLVNTENSSPKPTLKPPKKPVIKNEDILPTPDLGGY